MKDIIKFSEIFKAKLNLMLKEHDFISNQIFRLPCVRDLLVKDRFENIFYSNIRRSNSELSTEMTVLQNSNIDSMFFSGMSQRPDLIINVLASVNFIRQNAHRLRVLCIGARTEAEIFSLVNAGFHLKNISAIDLFSYTPHIEIGDVHNLRFDDLSFDVVICGWVLEFCKDVELACREIRRVVKKNGLICLGGMHHPSETDIEILNRRKLHSDRKWYCNIRDIKEIFNINDENFIFKSDIESADLDKRGEVIAIFKK